MPKRKHEAAKVEGRKRRTVHFDPKIPGNAGLFKGKKRSRSREKREESHETFLWNIQEKIKTFAQEGKLEILEKFLDNCDFLAGKKLETFYKKYGKELIYDGMYLSSKSHLMFFLSQRALPEDIFYQILSDNNYHLLKTFAQDARFFQRIKGYTEKRKADRIARLTYLMIICKDAVDEYVEKHPGEESLPDAFIEEYHAALEKLDSTETATSKVSP